MRNKLIEKTKDISETVDGDRLDFVLWDELSNEAILEMYVELRIADYLQTHSDMIKKWYTDASKKT